VVRIIKGTLHPLYWIIWHHTLIYLNLQSLQRPKDSSSTQKLQVTMARYGVEEYVLDFEECALILIYKRIPHECPRKSVLKNFLFEICLSF
jgi:hypothetical protein